MYFYILKAVKITIVLEKKIDLYKQEYSYFSLSFIKKLFKVI